MLLSISETETIQLIAGLTSTVNLRRYRYIQSSSIIVLRLFFSFQGSRIQSAKNSPMTPPLNHERQRHILCPAGGMGYSSSDSLDNQSRKCNDAAGLVSTPKLSSISGAKTETSSVDGSIRSSSEADRSGELSASDMESEWVEQDEPGVYITIRALPGGARELRRVRFRYVYIDIDTCAHTSSAHKNIPYDLASRMYCAAVRNSGKCMRGCGGKRTEPGYKNNTCDSGRKDTGLISNYPSPSAMCLQEANLNYEN